jgi:hypothetical protein
VLAIFSVCVWFLIILKGNDLQTLPWEFWKLLILAFVLNAMALFVP